MRMLCILLLLVGTAAHAKSNYPGCSKLQSHSIRTAIADAKALAVVAAASVGDTPIYGHWFGKYSPAKGEEVRRTIKSIVRGIRTGAVTAECVPIGTGACEEETYAFVYDDAAYHINICPHFFTLPKMSDLVPGEDESSNGTRAGTIIHEISHFLDVAGTEDECYSRSVCSRMAERASDRAVINADSYQYFAEDVTYYTINPEAWEQRED